MNASSPAAANLSATAFLCLLAGGGAIGFAPILVRVAENGPVASAFWRMAIAAPLLWLWCWRARAGTVPVPRPTNAVLFWCGLCFAGDLALWHWSILYTSVANSSLLVNLAPVFVTLIGWLLWRWTVSRRFLAALVIAVLGMGVLAGPNFADFGRQLMGDGLAVLAGIFYAGYLLAIKIARDAGMPTLPLMAWSTTITAVILLPAAVLSPQPFLPLTLIGWGVLIALALVTQILGQGLIAYALAHLPASLSSLTLLIQPVTAVLFAWILFGESLGIVQFAGGAIVLTGIWLARRSS
jgi:drug/metabolite transporter (DMT)-like permease